jgi:acetyl-CoA carboxylase biotin carboxyl carrier protein
MDLERIEALVNLMKSEGLTELTVESPDFKISIKREASPVAGGAPVSSGPARVESFPPEAPMMETGPIAVRSPAVGRLQLAEGVALGHVVAAGQVVAVVESMRIPNEVRAPAAGTVLEIFAQEGSVVEYGQPLMTIEPNLEVTIDETEV